MSERIELLDLTWQERQVAARLVARVARGMQWERVEAVFRSLGRAEWLVVPRATSLQGLLPMRQSPTLLRNERAWATAIVLALQLEVEDEKRVEHVLAFLAQRGSALEAFFIHEAAAMDAENLADKEGRVVS